MSRSPRLLLLDVPTSVLDLKYQRQLLRMTRAARYADRLLMLEQEHLMTDVAPAEVFSPELIARLYDYPAQVIHHPETGLSMVV